MRNVIGALFFLLFFQQSVLNAKNNIYSSVNIELAFHHDEDSTKFLGSWSFLQSKDGFIWQRVEKMKDATPGYIFSSGGKLIKRHPKNWHEDPAITYEDYEGTWKMLSPDVMEMFYFLPNGRKVRESVFINIFKDEQMTWQRLSWEEMTY
jgi:hypothetical protein